MTYHLSNLETNNYITLSKTLWLHILGVAINNGWKPKGTVMSLPQQDIHVTHFCGETFTIGTAINHTTHWCGNYTEIRKQIVTSRDSEEFADALRGADIEAEIIHFIEAGAFRIESPVVEPTKKPTRPPVRPQQLRPIRKARKRPFPKRPTTTKIPA